jgi:hypothetical protein
MPHYYLNELATELLFSDAKDIHGLDAFSLPTLNIRHFDIFRG